MSAMSRGHLAMQFNWAGISEPRQDLDRDCILLEIEDTIDICLFDHIGRAFDQTYGLVDLHGKHRLQQFIEGLSRALDP